MKAFASKEEVIVKENYEKDMNRGKKNIRSKKVNDKKTRERRTKEKDLFYNR